MASSTSGTFPLHQNSSKNEGLQKQMFQNSLQGKSQSQKKFASPTDNILSPCSQKLNAHKAKFFDKSKPTKLNFSDLE